MESQTPTILSQSHELVMQEAVAADAEAIAKTGATTFIASYGHSMPAEHMHAYLDEAYTPSTILKDLANRKNQFFVARLNTSAPGAKEGEGTVVGFIQMKLGTTEPCIPSNVATCELHRIYVSADHLGGGTGNLMVERGLRWARDHLLGAERLDGAVDGVVDGGVKEQRAGVWLGVWEENVKAQRFYRRWGFEKVGVHDFDIGDTKQTDSVMLKWL